MDVVQIFNGLGNQMSQYAFYYAKKKRHPFRTLFMTSRDKSQIQHNGYELETIFGIKSNKIKEKILFYFWRAGYFPIIGSKIFGRFSHYINEKNNYDFTQNMLEVNHKVGFTFYFGGWHSEKYFSSLRKELFSVFEFDDKKLNKESQNWGNIIKCDPNSCSVHVRRGDYLKDKKWSNAISPTYYDEAIKMIRSINKDTSFYVFSNDVNWCKQKFGNEGFLYIDCNKGNDSWQDMYLMTLCHHHINANSSFSWWGAWLCPFSDSVTIVPHNFISTMETKDIYPESWIKIR